jgi:hypothetical protein
LILSIPDLRSSSAPISYTPIIRAISMELISNVQLRRYFAILGTQAVFASFALFGGEDSLNYLLLRSANRCGTSIHDDVLFAAVYPSH